MAVRVDELDFRILREVLAGDSDYFRSDRATIQQIARRVGVHPNTAATRLRRLTEGRVFLPLTLDIEPGRVGLVGCTFFLDVPPERRTQETREGLFLVEGLWAVFEFVEGWLVLIYAEDDTALAQRVEMARRWTAARSVVWDADTRLDTPPLAPAKLSRLDVRIIAALLRNGRMPFGQVARQLGLSPRTVEKRYARLAKEGIVYQLPGGSPDLVGKVVGYVNVGLPPQPRLRTAMTKRVLEAFPQHFKIGRAHV